jgi:hypothetical protein
MPPKHASQPSLPSKPPKQASQPSLPTKPPKNVKFAQDEMSPKRHAGGVSRNAQGAPLIVEPFAKGEPRASEARLHFCSGRLWRGSARAAN